MGIVMLGISVTLIVHSAKQVSLLWSHERVDETRGPMIQTSQFDLDVIVILLHFLEK